MSYGSGEMPPIPMTASVMIEFILALMIGFIAWAVASIWFEPRYWVTVIEVTIARACFLVLQGLTTR